MRGAIDDCCWPLKINENDSQLPINVAPHWIYFSRGHSSNSEAEREDETLSGSRRDPEDCSLWKDFFGVEDWGILTSSVEADVQARGAYKSSTDCVTDKVMPLKPLSKGRCTWD